MNCCFFLYDSRQSCKNLKFIEKFSKAKYKIWIKMKMKINLNKNNPVLFENSIKFPIE